MSRFILRNFVQPLIELVLVVDGALIGALRDLLEILHALLDALYLEECLVKGEKLKRTAQSASEISIIGSGVVHDGRMLMDKIKKVKLSAVDHLEIHTFLNASEGKVSHRVGEAVVAVIDVEVQRERIAAGLKAIAVVREELDRLVVDLVGGEHNHVADVSVGCH